VNLQSDYTNPDPRGGRVKRAGRRGPPITTPGELNRLLSRDLPSPENPANTAEGTGIRIAQGPLPEPPPPEPWYMQGAPSAPREAGQKILQIADEVPRAPEPDPGRVATASPAPESAPGYIDKIPDSPREAARGIQETVQGQVTPFVGSYTDPEGRTIGLLRDGGSREMSPEEQAAFDSFNRNADQPTIDGNVAPGSRADSLVKAIDPSSGRVVAADPDTAAQFAEQELAIQREDEAARQRFRESDEGRAFSDRQVAAARTPTVYDRASAERQSGISFSGAGSPGGADSFGPDTRTRTSENLSSDVRQALNTPASQRTPEQRERLAQWEGTTQGRRMNGVAGYDRLQEAKDAQQQYEIRDRFSQRAEKRAEERRLASEKRAEERRLAAEGRADERYWERETARRVYQEESEEERYRRRIESEERADAQLRERLTAVPEGREREVIDGLFREKNRQLVDLARDMAEITSVSDIEAAKDAGMDLEALDDPVQRASLERVKDKIREQRINNDPDYLQLALAYRDTIAEKEALGKRVGQYYGGYSRPTVATGGSGGGDDTVIPGL